MKFPEQYYAGFISPFTGQKVNAFNIPFRGRNLRVIADNIQNFEHVSVSLPNRNPNWDEMCFVKDLFWDDEEMCMQLHPKKSEYVNFHQHCLHIWKCSDGVLKAIEEDQK